MRGIPLDEIGKLLPFSYTRIPAAIRNRLAFLVSPPDDQEIELARMLLYPDMRKTPVLLTHDVDTEWGYKKGIGIIRDIERHFDFQSTFFLVANSRSYSIEKREVQHLINEGCEIGSHGLHHDGKMPGLNHTSRLARISSSREILERTLGVNVKGFRIPWMTYLSDLFDCVEESGYMYDMSLFGITTTLPFRPVGHKVVEFPLTVPMDYYMLYRRRLTHEDFSKAWWSRISEIHSQHGVVVLLAHPDRYDLGGRPHLYRQVLEYIHDHNNDYEVITPVEVLKILKPESTTRISTSRKAREQSYA